MSKCGHRGEEKGTLEHADKCVVPLFVCAKYGTCVEEKICVGTKCCRICDDHTEKNKPVVKE